MAVVPSANPPGAIRAYFLPNPTPSSSIFPADRKRPLFLNFRIRSNILRVCCSNLKEDEVEALFKEDTQNSERDQWEIFKPWDVPWDWMVTEYIMIPYLMSLKSVAKLMVLYIFVSPHQPLPDDVFSLDWTSPFNFKNGWILWAVGGLSVASFVTFVIKAFIFGLHAGYADNYADNEACQDREASTRHRPRLEIMTSTMEARNYTISPNMRWCLHYLNHLATMRLLPMIGSSNISTVCLLGTVGILAPICEEVLYHGFLLASLTKWFPVTFSVVASSTIFTLAHHSPGKSLEIFIFGSVLGLIYAQMRNLLVPITMHALWNCGVILLLTYLHVLLTTDVTNMQSQGYDMH